MNESPDTSSSPTEGAPAVEPPEPHEHTATASTPPEADIRHMRPVDDPNGLGASEHYAGPPATADGEDPQKVTEP
jgi:hypothetical protein